MDGGGDIIVIGNPTPDPAPDPGYDPGPIDSDPDNPANTPPSGTPVALSVQTQEALKTVAKGVDGLDVVIKGIVQALKLVPGVSSVEVGRFEALDKTLEGTSLLLKTGAISEAGAKQAVEGGLDVAFGQASDVVISLAVGYMTNHVTELLPGYGKLIPFAAIVATYAASQAYDQVGTAVAHGVTEAIFAGIDLAISSQHWFQNQDFTHLNNSELTNDLVFHRLDEGLFGQGGYYSYQGSADPTYGHPTIGSVSGPDAVAPAIAHIYDEYAGRAATTDEAGYWLGVAGSNGGDVNTVRTAVLASAEGQNHTSAQIANEYQKFLLRDPTTEEQSSWHDIISQGASFNVLTDSLIRAAGSETGYVFKEVGSTVISSGVTSYHVDENNVDYLIEDFDPNFDTILFNANVGGSSAGTMNAEEVISKDGSTDVLIHEVSGHSILITNTHLGDLTNLNTFFHGY